MDEEHGFYLFVGVLIGTLIGFVIFSLLFLPEQNKISELGQTICEERFDMDYDSYNNGILECKHKPVVEEYDGIKIEINKMEYIV